MFALVLALAVGQDVVPYRAPTPQQQELMRQGKPYVTDGKDAAWEFFQAYVQWQRQQQHGPQQPPRPMPLTRERQVDDVDRGPMR